MTAAQAGVIGPNAITQVGAALRALSGAGVASDIFAMARLQAYLTVEPSRMVAESEAAALHRAVRARLGEEAASAVLFEAGLRTADYLLAHRIPRAAQTVLKILPAPLASRALLAAIRRHAWTFAGSGSFRAAPGNPAAVEIEGCPLCRGERSGRPLCGYYAAVFEKLFQTLVSPKANAAEVACEAMGAPACRFEIGW
jgi:divinyl protochlorophyllide a 8-vinyl-reductase